MDLMSSANGSRWLVTGASGLFGANAGLVLRNAIGLSRSGKLGCGYRAAIASDLRKPLEAAALVRHLRPSVVLHAGAMASHAACEQNPAEARLVNAEATGALARAAFDMGAKFIYLSTDAVFDGTRSNYRETDEPNPFSYYGETKLEGEQLARASHSDPLILRVNFFGWSPSGERSILEFFFRSLLRGQRVDGYVDITVTSLYVQHLLEVIVKLEHAGVSGLFHVTSPDSLTKAEFGLQVASTFALDASLIRPTTSLTGQGNRRQRNTSLCSDKVSRIVGPLPTQRAGILASLNQRRALAGLLRSSD